MKYSALSFQAIFFGILILTAFPNYADESVELVRLRNGYKKAIERAVTPLNEHYLDHLEKLLGEYTRLNELDAALQVREVIKIAKKKIESSPKIGELGLKKEKTDSEKFSDFLQKSKFSWEGRNGTIVIQFNDQKLVVNANGIEIMEKDFEIIAPQMLEFEWRKGEMNTLTVHQNKRQFTRKQQFSEGIMTGIISEKRPD